MPIHDQGYTRYGGSRERYGRRWWVIARAGLMDRLRERRMLGLLLASWAPFFVRAITFYLAANVQQAQFLAASAQTRSEEHTSELQSRFGISYAVFCLKKNT